MSDPIHVFRHEAMATFFEVRIAGEERDYAEQAAQSAFRLLDRLENLLSRFRENSEISQIKDLLPGETLRLLEPTFACLEIAKKMEAATERAFCVSPLARQTSDQLPEWSLSREGMLISCQSGELNFDLGAIGKGFALDRMAEELIEWSCPAFLLIAGGSSVLAGAAPAGSPGWSSGLGDASTDLRFWLSHCSLSGSGLAVKGNHIIDPRTGCAVEDRPRVWAIADSAAESDALSTAAMVLSEAEVAQLFGQNREWLVFLNEGGNWRHFGARILPPTDVHGLS